VRNRSNGRLEWEPKRQAGRFLATLEMTPMPARDDFDVFPSACPPVRLTA
jgi:hypothetical protein